MIIKKIKKRLGLTVRWCINEPDLAIPDAQCVQIEGTGDKFVTLFLKDGDILGVDVAAWDDEGDCPSIARVGQCWSWTEDAVDALTGEEFSHGWEFKRRSDGETWQLKSLSSVADLMASGKCGLKLRSTPDDELLAIEFEKGYKAAQADYAPNAAPQQPEEACCPVETCETCPEPWTCAGLRVSIFQSNVAENGEPLGWKPPENGV